MLRNIWTHRIIVLLNSLVFGLMLERLLPNPLWGVIGVIVLAVSGIWYLQHSGFLMRKLKFDFETAAIIRTIILALVFFIECAVAASLIL